MRHRKRYPRAEVPPHRYTASPQLRQAVDKTGRRLDWIASQLGMSRSHISHIVAGRRTISEADARVIVALIGGEFGVLFKLSDGSDSLSSDSDRLALVQIA